MTMHARMDLQKLRSIIACSVRPHVQSCLRVGKEMEKSVGGKDGDKLKVSHVL